MANPFKPTAGKTPPVIIGRQTVMDDFSRGLRNGAGARERLMLVTGQQGYGKTVMLSQLEKLAAADGWLVYSETASNGLVSRLIGSMQEQRALVENIHLTPEISLGGIMSAKLGDVQLLHEQQVSSLRDAVERVLAKLPDGKGVLVTVDESQAASREDLVALATAIQHVIRDEDRSDKPDTKKHGIALVLAALPSVVDDLTNDKVLTFLRRAKREVLGAVSIPDVRNSYIRTISKADKVIDANTAMEAATATGGNPFLVQLVGYYMFEAADTRHSSSIDRRDCLQGVSDALREYGETVCAPTYCGLTAMQQAFLRAMLEDFPREASTTDIGIRLGKSSGWVGKYCASLVHEQVIEPTGHGKVAFAIPHFGDWLQGLK